MAMGSLGPKWIESKLSLRKLDPTQLIWDMRRSDDLRELPRRRCTMQCMYRELSKEKQSYWMVVEKGKAVLCWVYPGFEVDLLVEGSLAGNDIGLDGFQHDGTRGGRRHTVGRRRSATRAEHAEMAGPLPLRQHRTPRRMMSSSDIGWFVTGMVPQVLALGPLLHSTAMLRGGPLPQTGHSIPEQAKPWTFCVTRTKQPQVLITLDREPTLPCRFLA